MNTYFFFFAFQDSRSSQTFIARDCDTYMHALCWLTKRQQAHDFSLYWPTYDAVVVRSQPCLFEEFKGFIGRLASDRDTTLKELIEIELVAK